VPGTTGPVPFVGRQRELDTLLERLTAAGTGAGGVVLLAGEPGIGKTHIAREFGAAARARGAAVLWGACFEGDWSPPYGPWADALSDYLRSVDPASVLGELGPGGGMLAHIVPNLRAGPAAGLPALPPGPAQDRFLLYDAVTRLLLGVERQPVVLVLDDLHWADGDSLTLLRHVARLTRRAPLLLVLAYRDAEVDPRHPLADVLAALHRETDCDHLVIRGLAEHDVATYLSEATGQALPPPFVRAIAAETGGNPFYLREVLRHLIEEGRLGHLADGATTDAETAGLGIPEGVRHVVAQRLARVSAETRAVLRSASAFTGGVDFPLLWALTELDEEVLLSCIDEALGAGLLRAAPGRRERYDFAHAIVRHTVYDELSPSRRVRLHRKIGEVLERLPEPAIAEHLGELAHHFFLAAPGGDASTAGEYARRAGDRARALLAYEEAARLYEMAAQAFELEEAPDGALRCELLLALGDALNRAGSAPRAKQVFQQAAEAARTLAAHASEGQAASFLARAALGFGWWVEGREDSLQIGLLREALAALGTEESALRATVLGRLAQALRFSVSREERAALGAEAVAMARHSGDADAIAAALRGRHWALFATEDLDDRLTASTDLMHLGEQRGDREIAFQGHSLRLMDLLEAGDIQAANAELESLERLAQELRQPLALWEVTLTRAMRGLFDGRFAEGEARAHEAADVGQQMGSWAAASSYQIQMFWLRRQRGLLGEEDVAFLKQGAEQNPLLLTTYQARLAFLYAELGRTAEAWRELDRVEGRGFADLRRDSNWLYTVMYLAEACVLLRDTRRAAMLHELLLPFAARNIVQSRPRTLCFGATARYLGLLAATLGHWDAAARHFEDALAMNARMGSRPYVAQTQYDYAAMLLRSPKSEVRGSKSKIPELLDRALATARELGVTRLAERIERLQPGTAGGPRAHAVLRTPRSALPDGLTAREAEVLRLIAAGRTNREIADDLVLSLTTVQRHIANIYGKIGARGRADATTYALRHGIAPADGNASHPR
jgi:DNA-binding NarL/FixJ family response regulator